MEDFWLNMAISTVLVAIKGAVKNKKKKATLKVALLKVRNAINELYPEEEES